MKKIADDLYAVELEIEGAPSYGIGIYVMGGVLVDSGIRQFADMILAQLDGIPLEGHALTHGHMDHQGSSHAICEARALPLFCPAGEADNIESGELASLVPDLEQNRLDIETYGGPPHPVARRLREGDEVGGFVVVDTPGHSPGHVSYWRASDRVLVVGDALRNWDMITGEIRLTEPLDMYTVDPPRNRESIRKLAALDPAVLCFGHGPALTDPAELHALVERLHDEVRA